MKVVGIGRNDLKVNMERTRAEVEMKKKKKIGADRGTGI